MELSVSDASGWRPQQPSVVAKYVATFPEEYGRTITAGVTLVSRDLQGNAAVDQDGRFIIDDGKSTVAALQTLQLHWNAVGREHMLAGGFVKVGLVYIGCTDVNGLYAEFVDSYSNNSFQLDYCDNLHVGH